MDLECQKSWIKLAQIPYQLANQIINQVDFNSDVSRQITSQLKRFSTSINDEVTQNTINWLCNEHNHLLTRDQFPIQLKALKDPPIVLFLSGNTALTNSKQIAIVGSRKPTAGGDENARYFSEYLATHGLTITSGLAEGIDGAAHEAALNVKGPTIAVLGTGHQHCYPKKHQRLFKTIIKQGLTISEFLPHIGVKAYHFPRRNRLISGLSSGVLIVEGAIKSGTLITCHLALEQGRDVFAIPSDISNMMARGCHKIIREGALLVDDPQQILDELCLMKTIPVNDVQQPKKKGMFGLTDQEKSVLQTINRHPTTIDQISARTQMRLPELLMVLFDLELKNHISVNGNCYFRS